ncbi:MAG: hypothetical protein ACLRJV_22655 [Eubacteriales bacterium]
MMRPWTAAAWTVSQLQALPESSPVGISQEAPGVGEGRSAGDRTEGIAPVLEAGTEGGGDRPAAQAEGGGLDPPEAPLPSGESEQTGEAGRKHRSREKPKRKRVSRKRQQIPRKIHPAARPLGRPPRRLRRKIPPAAPRMI